MSLYSVTQDFYYLSKVNMNVALLLKFKSALCLLENKGVLTTADPSRSEHV